MASCGAQLHGGFEKPLASQGIGNQTNLLGALEKRLGFLIIGARLHGEGRVRHVASELGNPVHTLERPPDMHLEQVPFELSLDMGVGFHNASPWRARVVIGNTSSRLICEPAPPLCRTIDIRASPMPWLRVPLIDTAPNAPRVGGR